MACDCIDVMDAKMAELNTRLVGTIVFPRDGSPSYTKVTLSTEKLNTRSRVVASAWATFCPFCGVRYGPELKAAQVTDHNHHTPGDAR